MKIQYLAIIFVIIIVPISLIMSAYIQNQIDAIQMQADFDRNLINATYDAVKGFQINTTNNKYSSISDSKIRDIEAAVNTFYNTLNTAMVQYSYSVDDVKLYIPALLFTLYDGLYISTNYDNVYSTIGEGEDQKVDIKLNGKNYQNGVKPYIYYSAKYRLKNGNIIVVNYTLDNEITVYGDFGDGEGYITRSGYLINPDLVKDIDVNAKTLKYDGVEIGPEALTERLITIEDQERGTTKTDDYVYIFYQNDKIYLDHDDAGNPLRNDDGTLKIFWYNNYQKTYVNDASIRQYATNCGMRSTSAFDYYYEAKDFSEWARDKLGDIEFADTLRVEDGITPVGDNVWYTDEQTGEEVPYLSENTGDAKLFYADENNDPMLSGSVFNNHRLSIIRKTIETSLNIVISNYKTTTLYDYAMPELTESDWYRILNNVSVVAFMQGMSIGFRPYNNYAIVTNNINKEVVKPENIYIIAKEDGSNNKEYHQPGCKDLIEGVKSGKLTIIGAYPIASFQRQTVKISENDERYFYYQATGGDVLTGCYNCIVDATGDYDINDIIDGTIEHYEDETNILYDENDIKEVRATFLKALARERYDLYKSNFDLEMRVTD